MYISAVTAIVAIQSVEVKSSQVNFIVSIVMLNYTTKNYTIEFT